MIWILATAIIASLIVTVITSVKYLPVPTCVFNWRVSTETETTEFLYVKEDGNAWDTL